MRHFIILNDGTDEIYNLNVISASSLQEFRAEFIELFGDQREHDYQDWLEDPYYSKSFIEMLTEEDQLHLLKISNKSNQTSFEDALLDTLHGKFTMISDKSLNFK